MGHLKFSMRRLLLAIALLAPALALIGHLATAGHSSKESIPSEFMFIGAFVGSSVAVLLERPGAGILIAIALFLILCLIQAIFYAPHYQSITSWLIQPIHNGGLHWPPTGCGC